MKTEQQKVRLELTFWAIPLNSWDDQPSNGDTHTVAAYLHGKPYQDEAIQIHTTVVEITVPEAKDLHARTIEALKTIQQDTLDAAMKDARKYDSRIQELLAIESQ